MNVLRSMFTLLVFGGMLNLSVAQAGFDLSKTELGAYGGFNFHNVSGIDTEGYVGLILSIYGKYPITDLIGIQTELAYVQQGASRSAEYLGIDVTTEFNLDYIGIPILLTVEPFDLIQFHAGIQPSILVNKNTIVSSEFGSSSSLDDVDSVNGNVDFPLVFGAKLDLPFWDGNWTFDVNVRRGLMNIAEDKSYTWKHTGFAIAVGF